MTFFIAVLFFATEPEWITRLLSWGNLQTENPAIKK